jgi:hypothetical protein
VPGVNLPASHILLEILTSWPRHDQGFSAHFGRFLESSGGVACVTSHPHFQAAARGVFMPLTCQYTMAVFTQ